MNEEAARPEIRDAGDGRVSLVIDGRHATITLQVPPLNIFDFDVIEGVRGALKAVRSQGVAVVVLRSAIPGVFSAGVDVKIHTPELAPRMLRRFHDLIRRIDAGDAVFIAEVDGACLGGGFELALICDFAVVSERSTFGFPEIDLGCFPPVAAVLLPRRSPAACPLLLTGRRIDATEAHRLGLVHQVESDVTAAVAALADTLLNKSGHALRQARRALRSGRRGSLSASLEKTERLYERKIVPSKDAAEGVSAFLEKRRPHWRHA